MEPFQSFEEEYCSAVMASSEAANHYDVVIKGRINEPVDGGIARFLAPSPPDYRASFSGSGLPFSSREQAFSHTPNKGMIQLEADGSFRFGMFMPNSYYNDFQGNIVPPHVLIMYSTGGKTQVANIQLQQGVPYRSLTYPALRADVSFYQKGWSLPVRTQEKILRSAGYPEVNVEARDFWGGKPPQ